MIHSPNREIITLPTVAVALEVEVDMKYPALKCALESLLMRVLPLLVHNLKRNIFVWGASMEPYDTCFTATSIFLDRVSRGLDLVHEVGVKDVELIALDGLWRWIVMIVMGLIVLVPFITSVYSVKVLWFSGTVLVMPPINLQQY